ncbi:hypothetical protein L2K70_08665 [Nocardioides KLBMP 9356]|uniref:Htaa domain-containing protein n=1 Tax=Nocardioides potassii TaxID=2911371 RepID=A0ABS9HBR3_9ACTN|nr:hypothetical protein [Nocardioides potassii]MCF6377675.1 hypothetical protein [Nocardioides potassii]
MALVASATMLAALGAAPAQAAEGAQRLTGPGTGDPDVFLTYVGCDALFGAAQPPQSRLNLGPYTSPLGRRSLGLVPASGGTASGPFTRFGSLAALDASVAVASTSGSTGVSYVMAITPDNVPGTAWRGRAALSAPAGSWTTVSTAATSYDWTLVDLATLASLGSSETATPAAFAAGHGDGAGFVVTGFGCDGSPFNIDAVRGAGRTFDWEGTALATGMSVDRTSVDAGQSVSLTGRVSDPGGRVTGDPLVLESRRPGGAWAPVGDLVVSGPGGLSRVDVPVTETTEFRWHRPESQYADEGWSDAVTVTVAEPAAAPEGASKK